MSEMLVEFDELSGEESSESLVGTDYSDAVVHATDWTAETIVSQLERGNISLNPRFQRRDAWSIQQKSRFVESVVMGLPVPQIVLAELHGQRGKYLVLDGKQRLLSLLQFWGLGEGEKNRYALSGLKVLTHLNRKRLDDVEADPELASEYVGLLNSTVRTVVIRNWPSSDFLHMVFLRLNTGSTKLSPQELRQALQPGPFADWVDEVASKNKLLQDLLGINEPDSRMRDTEVLARFVAFNGYAERYPGRLKRFLDETFETLNSEWDSAFEEAPGRLEAHQSNLLNDFNTALEVSLHVFTKSDLARRPGSRPLNRTILDMLLFYAAEPEVAVAMRESPDKVRAAYASLFEDQEFLTTIDSDTASTVNTVARLQLWGTALGNAIEIDIRVPTLDEDGPRKSIAFPDPSV